MTKENSLYLTIKQQFFDEIVAGTKIEEYRDIVPFPINNQISCI
jgi:hypothetical protein